MEASRHGITINYCSAEEHQARLRKVLDDIDANNTIFRLWAKDATLFSGTNEGDFLDWLKEPESLLHNLDPLYDLRDAIIARGFSSMVLLGMGGSSLSPLMFKRVFQATYPFYVLDTIHPSAIARLSVSINLTETLFIVSSKSGTTLEPLLLYRYFLAKLGEQASDDPFSHFMAITDPHTALEKEAHQSGFLHGPFGKPGIGGRFSGLSAFGIMPAILMGIDVERLLLSARSMANDCGPSIGAQDNPAAELAAFLLASLKDGQDQILIHLSPTLKSFGLWLEQLIAESLGKNGFGLVPIIFDSDAEITNRTHIYIVYGDETKSLCLTKDSPRIVMELNDRYDLGGLMYLFQMAVALIASVVKINPFDQPNVERSKQLTKEVLQALEHGDKLTPKPVRSFSHGSFSGDVEQFIAALKPNHYCALLAFLDDTDENSLALLRLRSAVQEKTKVPVMLEFGPRYLHSTGQLFKGGADNGHFLVVTGPYPHDMPSAHNGLWFSDVHLGQALGDIRAMKESGRSVLHVHLADVHVGLDNLCKRINSL